MYAALHYPWLQGFNAHTVAHAVFELAARRASFGEGVRAALAPSAEYFQTLHLPDALIHWGHPGLLQPRCQQAQELVCISHLAHTNRARWPTAGSMAVVLVAMGLYGSGYLGWQLRLSDDTAVVTKARALHPRLALGMTGFFALGAVGGMMSLIMQDRPVFARCGGGPTARLL